MLSLSSVRELSATNITEAQKHHKEYKKKARTVNYRVGDWVFVRFPEEGESQGQSTRSTSSVECQARDPEPDAVESGGQPIMPYDTTEDTQLQATSTRVTNAQAHMYICIYHSLSAMVILFIFTFDTELDRNFIYSKIYNMA